MIALSELLKGLKYECVSGSEAVSVASVTNDSRNVEQGSLFICITGYQSDGHDYATQAAAKGARVLVTEREVLLDNKSEVTVIRVRDSRYAMAFISAAWFGHPAREMTIIGLTGTKGKSTTSYLIKSILEKAGHKVGLIGTIEIIIGDEHIHASNTTPESYLLQQYFRQMKEQGCDVVVLEAASQGFKLHRTEGFVFDIGVFTNIEPDHIGPNEHKDFEEYLTCKSRLFKQCKVGIVNRDDAHAQEVIKGHTCTIETFGFAPDADLYAGELSLVKTPGSLGAAFAVHGLKELEVEVGTPGRFSAYNALAAIAVCSRLAVSDEAIRAGLMEARTKGRIEIVKLPCAYTLLIDYAHNAMSLENVLSTLREYEPNRLICLFGCGGNRARSRRFEMGEVSGRLADLTIITSDNPRFEEPLAIMADIREGIAKTNGSFVELCDRKEAIRYAITHGEPGDIIVLAGKGHEDYQEIKGVKYPMDERIIIQEIEKELGWKENTQIS